MYSSPSNPRPLPRRHGPHARRPWGVAGTLHRLNAPLAPPPRTVHRPVSSSHQCPPNPAVGTPLAAFISQFLLLVFEYRTFPRPASPCHRGVHGPRHTFVYQIYAVPECPMYYFVTVCDVGARSNRRAWLAHGARPANGPAPDHFNHRNRVSTSADFRSDRRRRTW
jgi:hypothetical protein